MLANMQKKEYQKEKSITIQTDQLTLWLNNRI